MIVFYASLVSVAVFTAALLFAMVSERRLCADAKVQAVAELCQRSSRAPYVLFFAGFLLCGIVGCTDSSNRATVHDLAFSNPGDPAGNLPSQVHRFAVEWRVVDPELPLPCAEMEWAGGCAYVTGETCVIYVGDPMRYPLDSWERGRQQSYLAHEIMHCAGDGMDPHT